MCTTKVFEWILWAQNSKNMCWNCVVSFWELPFEVWSFYIWRKWNLDNMEKLAQDHTTEWLRLDLNSSVSNSDAPNPNYSLYLNLHLFPTSVFTSSYPAWVDRAGPFMWNSLLYRLDSSKPVISICLIFNHFRRWIIIGSYAWIHHKSLLLLLCWVSRLNWISFHLCLIIVSSYSP